ncbi:MAG: hypothetical protein RL172_818 [Bacteroidota bacterium]
MSESLHAGHLPLWNPYINYGYPLYGDMSSGFWSPITWLIAATVGYNAYSFTLELLLYLMLAAIGMYQLTKQLKLGRQVCLIAALAYLCCGYMVGHLQHFNWISGAALLPWCLYSYHRLLHQNYWYNYLIAAICFYLLAASAHPGITISCGYFFIAYSLFCQLQQQQKKWPQFAIKHLGLAILLLILAAGMIAGYADILPHFVRGQKLSLQSALLMPTTTQSWISLLLPFTTVKQDAFFATDISMRNCYLGICMLLFLGMNFFTKKTPLQYFLLFTGIAFALLATGGIFKTVAYKLLPMMGYIRLNGEFRIIAIFCFIIYSAIGLNQYFIGNKPSNGLIKKTALVVQFLLVAAIFCGLYGSFILKDSFLFNLQPSLKAGGLATTLKTLINSISWYDCFWMQGCIQLVLVRATCHALLTHHYKRLITTVVIDLALATLLNIPFTGVGSTSVATVQAVLNQSPKGIPAPGLQPILKNDTGSVITNNMIGHWTMYNKQIGSTTEVLYPIVLTNTRQYFDEQAKPSSHHYFNQPYLFIQDSNSHVEPIYFSPQKIEVQVQAGNNTAVVLQQNYYPHWWYVDGQQKRPMQLYGTSFMSAAATPASKKISIIFEPVLVTKMMLLSLAAFIGCIIGLMAVYVKRFFPSSQ